MLQLELNKEKNNAHFFLKFGDIKLHIRPYFYVEKNKLVNGYVGLIFNTSSPIKFSTYFDSGILSFDEAVNIVTKKLQQEEFLNQEVLIKLNNK